MPYSVEIVVEETEESVAGVGDAICRKAEELEAAAVRAPPCLPAARAPAESRVLLAPTARLSDQLTAPAAGSFLPLCMQVVLGSHMHGGLLQLVLGSVAARVARHCSRPVAILH